MRIQTAAIVAALLIGSQTCLGAVLLGVCGSARAAARSPRRRRAVWGRAGRAMARALRPGVAVTLGATAAAWRFGLAGAEQTPAWLVLGAPLAAWSLGGAWLTADAARVEATGLWRPARRQLRLGGWLLAAGSGPQAVLLGLQATTLGGWLAALALAVVAVLGPLCGVAGKPRPSGPLVAGSYAAAYGAALLLGLFGGAS